MGNTFGEGPVLPPSSRSIAVGVEHIHLSYRYLDLGDLDGYLSLVDTGARFELPGRPVARGQVEVADLVFDHVRRQGPHTLDQVTAHGDRIRAAGRLGPRTGRNPTRKDFTDIITITDLGLLLSWRRFHSVE